MHWRNQRIARYSELRSRRIQIRRSIMEWTTPTFEEVNLSCEISSYADAEL
jgi:coenzyme PQQ precursor peptide PqqA